jgi:branched-chain amino acid transport system substrate-binding protein
MSFLGNAVLAAATVASGALAGVARADIDVGVTLSATGPAASLGIPEKNMRADAAGDRRRRRA